MKASTTQKKENNALWWGAWMATLVSFIIGGAVAWAIAGPVRDPLSGLFAGAIAGAMIGSAQWLALRSLLTTSVGTKWAAATTLGISIGVAAGAALVSYRTGGTDLAVMGFVTGVSVGALQAWALKDRVPASWRWLLLNPPLWAASWLITWGISVDVAAHWAVFGLSGAILYTVIAGFVLRFLLREASPTPAPTANVINPGAQKVENVVPAVNVSSAN
jgi:hypothetical protein